ncbi:autotransporter outer membrane beta-barrel domain-containing protein [Lampropedia aestuarii]|uniref:autotransporter outer membrane beta-barrel domain-containing protein n=1 Tax=Lampropedia aestuarii TaxID=2562762 RepID=UPI0024691B9C|nr:autotransporter outer membrane beta-barrel domain-containing protein [Lampropedia aestuarii]MDH5855739.1 autotransporter outer membrane beta-barrel domain-containing protein [Lampropedia aestuarii]
MGQRRISTPQKTLLAKALVCAFTAVSANSAFADTNYLIDEDASDPQSWSAGETFSDGGNIINRPGTWVAGDMNDYVDFGYGLYIGYEDTGSLDITITPEADFSSLYIEPSHEDPNLPPLVDNWDPSLRVGDHGGTGTLTIQLQELPEDESSEIRLYIDEIGLGVGLGANSNGVVHILGTGKNNTAAQFGDPNAVLFDQAQQNFYIGHSGGRGRLTIEGAGLTADLGQRYDESLPFNYFSVGEGADTFGTVNVLAKGKLAIGNPAWDTNVSYEPDKMPLSFIGKDGGEGVVTVEVSTSDLANQTHFNLGLAVGMGGGIGTLDVLQGGKSFISTGPTSEMNYEGSCQASEPGEYPIAPAPLWISVDDSSTGLVRTSGANSQLLVAGKSPTLSLYADETYYIREESIGEIQIGTGGTLVASDDGTIKVGVSRLLELEGTNGYYYSRETVGGLGPITVLGAGAVVYGSESNTPTLAGNIEAAVINLQNAAARLVFNHSGNLNFNLPLAGNGLLTQQSGTTTIAATLVGLPALNPMLFAYDREEVCTPAIATNYPVNQAAFTGGIDVQGGNLVLPISHVLPSLASTRISGGSLQMGSTDQNLGTVDLAGGQLLLSGGQAPGPTNTATASDWTGSGGTVVLDTVLGVDGNDSDKLFITGTITGTTLLQINNFGGSGAQTTGDGILVVEAEASHPSNHFALAAPVISNGFQYRLQQTGSNWYLVSSPYVAPPQQAIPVPATSLFGLLGLGGLLAVFARRSLTAKNRSQALR